MLIVQKANRHLAKWVFAMHPRQYFHVGFLGLSLIFCLLFIYSLELEKRDYFCSIFFSFYCINKSWKTCSCTEVHKSKMLIIWWWMFKKTYYFNLYVIFEVWSCENTIKWMNTSILPVKFWRNLKKSKKKRNANWSIIKNMIQFQLQNFIFRM